MESLNLNTLATSLPTGQQNAEKELMNNFKAAALSITTLYRSSRQNAKKAYNAGYAAACQDLLNMIQQGVSVGGIGASGSGSHGADDDGMTIGRVMDWIEARLEAIKSREEEEDEDEEKEKERTKPSAPASKPDIKPNPAPQSTRESKPTYPTPCSPNHSNPTLPAEPSTPSPPPSSAPSATRATQRQSKHKFSTKADAAQFPAHSPSTPTFNFNDNLTSAAFSDVPLPGNKRRHAVMMMLDPAASPVALGGTSSPNPPTASGGVGGGYNGGTGHNSGGALARRRTRSSRNLPLQQGQNQNINVIQAAAEAMDVEEDGGSGSGSLVNDGSQADSHVPLGPFGFPRSSYLID
ncbi:hypothetical protein BDQ17DRAFT_1423169 [Cyathus striatus]|nr:hypothetical protein BDQ17DRAFT_1423169 [Cyathus striatus]